MLRKMALSPLDMRSKNYSAMEEQGELRRSVQRNLASIVQNCVNSVDSSRFLDQMKKKKEKKVDFEDNESLFESIHIDLNMT